MDFGCDYCADEQNRWYGHVTQVGTHATEGLLLLRCPRCATFYEMDGVGAKTGCLTESEARDRYPHVSLDLAGVRLVWFDDWYDGPMNGLASYEGRELWFDVEDADEWFRQSPRRYRLVQLTEEELTKRWQAHRAWEAAVAADSKQAYWDAQPEAEHDPGEPRFPTNPVVGTFTFAE